MSTASVSLPGDKPSSSNKQEASPPLAVRLLSNDAGAGNGRLSEKAQVSYILCHTFKHGDPISMKDWILFERYWALRLLYSDA